MSDNNNGALRKDANKVRLELLDAEFLEEFAQQQRLKLYRDIDLVKL